MDGAFRFGKSIVASLTLAALALAGRYVHSCVFSDVEQPASIVVDEDIFRQRTSLSAQRSVRATDAVWRIAVVTNRPGVAGSEEADVHQVFRGSLLQQAREISLQNPASIYAFSDVVVPDQRIRGRCDVKQQAIGGIAVGELQIASRDRFLAELQGEHDGASASDVLVFVHGFNVNLDHAIARAAQIAEDIPFHGTIIAFSWPSRGRTDAYRSDELTAERYFWNLAELLHDVKSRLPNSRLHVLTHSMGNRVTLRAINALCGTIDPMGRRDAFALSSLARGAVSGSNRRSNLPRFQSVVSATSAEIKQRYPQWGTWAARPGFEPMIDQLIMAAPDVDAAEYQTWVRGLKHACKNLVLYASDTDFALEGSRMINRQGYRAGDSRANLNIEGLTTIRVTGVAVSDRLGHSFYGSRPAVLNQLAVLLNEFRGIDSVAALKN